MSRRIGFLLLVATCMFMALGAQAQQDQPVYPLGSVSVQLTSIAVGIGGSWGSGVLIFQGQEYPIKMEGLAIGATVGMAVGRIGDIINGEHFADSTDLPWGVVYTDPNSPSFLRFGAGAAPQHPAVAYEMIGDLAIFVALLFIYFRVPRAGATETSLAR